ncbi:MAG TPA: hypothetical protein VGN20_12350 [Mucilaginibacter sp.]|jgi:hypothetical protein
MSRRSKKSEAGSPKSEVGGQNSAEDQTVEEQSKSDSDSHLNEHPTSEIKNKSNPDSYRNVNPTSKIERPISEIKKQSTANSKLQTENMEVHHHPEIEKKGFKEYLLEGLMIFLAVTMGFFAESLREHLSDKSKGTEYLASLTAELRNDINQYDSSLQRISELRPELDSLFNNVSYLAQYNYTLKGKWNTPVNEINISYMPALAIIQQLKSSGSLRLINNKEIALRIIKYETFVEGSYKLQFNAIADATNKLYALEDELSDETDFNNKVNDNMIHHISNDHIGNTGYYDMPIKIRDALKLNQLANSAVNYNARCWGYTTSLNSAKKQADELIKLINKEYDLKNE